MILKRLFAVSSLFALAACQTLPAQVNSEDNILRIFETLASDEMAGRKTGTEENRKARDFLLAEAMASKAFDNLKLQRFEFERKIRGKSGKPSRTEQLIGMNLMGAIDVPDDDTGPLLVITAHYDHLGEHDGKIYNGADDNASGSAALFAIADSFKRNPPRHDVLIVWLDAEEMSLSGAKGLLDGKNNFSGRPVFNLNLDMISQSEGEIYFAGAHHTPALKPLIEAAASDVTLSFGHDAPEDGGDDWTLQSDHGVFHRRGIPFGYFGVEDHPHYHSPTDTFETVPQKFYANSVQTIVNASRILDENLGDLARAAKVE